MVVCHVFVHMLQQVMAVFQQYQLQKVPKSQRSKVRLVLHWCRLNASSSRKKKRVKCHLSNISTRGSAGHVPFRSLMFWFQLGAEKKETLSAAPSASSLPELLPKIAASTIAAEEAPAALFKPTVALWQGRTPPVVHSCCFSTSSHVLHINHLSAAWFGKYSSVLLLTSAFNLVFFMQHVFCLTSFANSSGLVLIRVKWVSQGL